MKRLVVLVFIPCLLTIAAPASASQRIYLKGPYPTRCVRDLTKSHPYTTKKSYTVTRRFFVKDGIQHFTSRQKSYRLFRTSRRSFSANGVANNWSQHFTFLITRWNRDLIGTKYKGTAIYRRTYQGRNYVDYYNCVGTLNS